MSESLRWFAYMLVRRIRLFASTVFREWNEVRLWPPLAWNLAGIIWHYDDDWGREMWRRRGYR